MSSMKPYPLAILIPIFSFISILLSLSPLLLHAKNRNYPATALICWAILLSVFNIINALLWPTDDTSVWWNGTGLCDIEVKFMVASYVAVPAALTCIFRGLSRVLDTSRAVLVPSKSQRWRNRMVELLLCVFVPIMAMVTHFVYQKDRYLLYAISGCVNNYDESWPSFVLAWMWPPILCLISAYYCCLVLIRLHRYRSDFEVVIRSSNSNMSKSRFLRLFLVAFTMLIAILPLQGYVVYRDLKSSLPWHSYSFSQVHHDGWDKIIKVPTQGRVFFDRWTPVAIGVLIFIFCGFGRDAIRVYRTILWRLGFGHCFPSVSRPTNSQASIRPAHVSNSTTLVETPRHKKSLFNWRKNTYNDIEKGLRLSSRVSRDKVVPWYRNPLSFFNRRFARSRDQVVLLNDITVPGQTMCTTAWAAVSESRPSSEMSDRVPSTPVPADSIHIKHVISQSSEIHFNSV
ncbi:Fungal pheromone STE3 GPCR [Penicillium odoratum]|uniref:Fungal pheromone STE3 GPCR n=1 Tax=Penicillium odoratum TaxID=1167516 RepID=UPI00254742E3|nr:Fungal pheromone STE3 GPCR [Penicillium odoratum]KAJ5776993.1 Fungal pheromone STE3 GPCR [Penicillium odoratum]